jgi:chromosome segregation ATPase
MKNNTDTVMKAKQESFRMMTEETNRNRKLIEDQQLVIKNLKLKLESLEEESSRSQAQLQARLDQKDADLQIKIAAFEANLHEGRQYFEEILNEKDNQIKKKNAELKKVNKRVIFLMNSTRRIADTTTNDDNENDSTNDSEHFIGDLSNVSNESDDKKDGIVESSIQKFETENINNIKRLYEHQIELLRVKIEMLEKTCTNYKLGIKDMNKSFGVQQQTDEMTSIQTFKDLMQDMQKQNAQLETERIELQVKSSNLAANLDALRLEKDNITKKYQAADSLSQRLINERSNIEEYHQQQLRSRDTRIVDLDTNQAELSRILGELHVEVAELRQTEQQFEELTIKHQQLTKDYEELYAQASDIVAGNNLLNEKLQNCQQRIEEVENNLNDSHLKCEHLSQCNSELSTIKIDLEMKLETLKEEVTELEVIKKEMIHLRDVKSQLEQTKQELDQIRSDIEEKNTLIEELMEAKEFLVENNSNMLTNNIKMQLYVEAMGLDVSDVESHPRVVEYQRIHDKYGDIEQKLTQTIESNEKLENNNQVLKQLHQNLNERVDALVVSEIQFKQKIEELNEINDNYLKELNQRKLKGKI